MSRRRRRPRHCTAPKRQGGGVRKLAESHPVDHTPFYTVASLAARLSLSTRTVRRILDSREIPYYVVKGRRRIDSADVDHYLAERRIDSVKSS